MLPLQNLRIGHFTDLERGTGCTVVLCEQGAVAGVDVRGAAPGTRETDLLHPSNLVTHVHAVLLCGGSAFGLAAADGVMRYLYERGVGFPAGPARVPIVPAAVLFDLGVGQVAWPDAEAGYHACEVASNRLPAEGSVGAGTGATVGKLLGPGQAVKGGIGFASVQLADGVTVAALVACNAAGSVVDPTTGQTVAGPRDPNGGFMDGLALLTAGASQSPFAGTNTTIGVVITDAGLTKAQAHALARVAHDGLAWAVRPAHTPFDGDALFALSVGDRPANPMALGAAAAVAVSQAIGRGVSAATGLHGVPAVRDLATT